CAAFLEFSGQRDTDGARLNDGHGRVWRLETAVVGNAAGIAQVLAVQHHPVVIVVEAEANRGGVVARQDDLARDRGRGDLKIAAARADIAPGSPDEAFIARE